MLRIHIIIDKKVILKHLLFEIRSQVKVESYGLKTLLPPADLCREYLDSDENEPIEVIKRWMVNDLKQNDLPKRIKEFETRWIEIEKYFFAALETILKKDTIKEYNIYPTLYGPGGSYELPNKVFIRIATENDMDYLDVNIAHEIIHLNVEDVVQRKKLSHEDKELLVNSIMFQPEIAKILGINNEEIKKSKYYNNLDEIL